MPDDLYDTDILAWSKAQADRLRRVAAGERVNDLDWAHVIEEVEDVGKSQLAAVTSLIAQALQHALKIAAWPDHVAVPHWEAEIAGFMGQIKRRFEPGMQQHVDPAALYAEALEQVRQLRMQGAEPRPLPDQVTFSTADFRGASAGVTPLLERIRAAQGRPADDRQAP
ncbi:MAG: DUF29 domain-containing protein [Paracraurococcus sp.]